MLIKTNEIVEVSERYDDSCEIGQTCTVEFKIDDDMDQPVMVYYELRNYFQNHRLYLNSRSMDQLAGEDVSKTDTDPRGFELKTICEDALYVEDMDRSDWAINQFQ